MTRRRLSACALAFLACSPYLGDLLPLGVSVAALLGVLAAVRGSL